MPDLSLIVQADEALPLDLVLKTLADAERVLADVERGVSRSDRRVGEVLIERVTDGSVAVQLRYRARSEDHDSTVARAKAAFVDGLAALADATSPPPYFSSGTLDTLQRMSRRLHAVDAGRLVVSDGHGAPRAIVDGTTREKVQSLLRARHEALGSVTGVLEAINIHEQRVMRVYSKDWSGSIECHFAHALTDDVAAALGRRVIATGVIHRTATGEPIRLELVELTTLPDTNELPSIDDLVGIDPDFAGGLPGEDYVARQRR